MKYDIVSISPILLLLSMHMPVHAADPLEARFRAEYPGAAAKLEASASKMKCAAVFKIEGSGGFKSSVIERTVYMNGKNNLVVEDFKINHDVPATATVVYGVNADSFFQLERPAPEAQFKITYLSKIGNVQENELNMKMLAHCYFLTYGATAIGGIPLKKIMSHPSFKITKITRPKKGESGCEIAFVCDDPTHWIVGGTVGVDPSLGWALTGYDVKVSGDRSGMTKDMPKGTRYKGAVRCRDWGDGHIFPAEISFRFSYPHEPHGPEPLKRLNIQSYDYTNIPDSQFRLSAFGLPDIGEPSRRSYAGHTAAWLFGLGVVFLVAAIGLKYYANRLQHQ